MSRRRRNVRAAADRIRRRFTAPGIIGRFSEKSTLSDSNLKRHGFKKLVNEGDGKFKVTL